MKRTLVLFVAIMLVLMSGCYSSRERELEAQVAQYKIQLQQANDRTEQAIALVDRAVKAAERW